MNIEHEKTPAAGQSTAPDGEASIGDAVRIERRAADRTRDDTDWESKVLARLNGRLKQMSAPPEGEATGWEADVLAALRKRIDRAPQ